MSVRNIHLPPDHCHPGLDHSPSWLRAESLRCTHPKGHKYGSNGPCEWTKSPQVPEFRKRTVSTRKSTRAVGNAQTKTGSDGRGMFVYKNIGTKTNAPLTPDCHFDFKRILDNPSVESKPSFFNRFRKPSTPLTHLGPTISPRKHYTVHHFGKVRIGCVVDHLLAPTRHFQSAYSPSSCAWENCKRFIIITIIIIIIIFLQQLERANNQPSATCSWDGIRRGKMPTAPTLRARRSARRPQHISANGPQDSYTYRGSV